MPIKIQLPFLGEYPGLIDEKGRLSFPADYRRALPEENEGQIVLALGNSNFLYVFPLAFYNELYAKARTDPLSFADEVNLSIDSLISGKSAYRVLDSQGRITMPQNLLKQAGIGREVMFMGRWNHFVIWDRKAYEVFSNQVGIGPNEAWLGMKEQGQKG